MVISPWCASIIFWEMASPSPLPLALEEKNGWKIFPDLLGDSHTGVRDFHEYPTHLPAGGNGQCAAGLHGLDTILGDIQDHLAYMSRVKFNLRQIGIQFQR